MATVTFQNYFRMYRRLAGMTGTALTESEEFDLIYGLEVVVIPTHRPLVRIDHSDVVYKSLKAKFDAVFAEIEDCHKRGQPVLVGTLAIETSEMIAKQLKRMGIDHEVLNAKQHEREAHIIAQAGRPGAVTIATNMAGRGVDILLGGNPEGLAREALRRKGYDLQTIEPEVWQEALAQAEAECKADRQIVLAAGGLHVLGTERYEARRIDNQLRGRAGRQGDPGSSRFFVALEDDLMRLFGGAAVARLMDRLGVEEDVPIDAAVVSKAIASAQIRVEGHNFDMRKHLLEYDDVVNQQRKVIYEQRRTILTETDLSPILMDVVDKEIRSMVATHTASAADDWDVELLLTEAKRDLDNPVELAGADPQRWNTMQPDDIAEELIEIATKVYERKSQAAGPELWLLVQRWVMLRAVDRHWVRHLTALDELREGIGLRAVGQRNPLVEYKREAFDAFEQLLGVIEDEISRSIFNVRLGAPPQTRSIRPTNYSGAGVSTSEPQRPVKQGKKVGRNDPCPCGSGKKFKYCCERAGLTQEEAAAKGAKQKA